MTKAQLISQLAISTGIDKNTVSAVVEAMMNNIKENVCAGENVYLRGFGSFISKTRAAKVARNITANSSVLVPEHRVAAFKPAAEFAEAIKSVKK